MKDKDEESLPKGARGAGVRAGLLDSCSLPPACICLQALVELCRNLTASASSPPWILRCLGFILVFSLDPHLIRQGREHPGAQLTILVQNALGDTGIKAPALHPPALLSPPCLSFTLKSQISRSPACLPAGIFSSKRILFSS